MTQESHQELAHLRAEVERLHADNSKAISALTAANMDNDSLKDQLQRSTVALKKLWEWNCTEKGYDPGCLCPACSIYKNL